MNVKELKEREDYEFECNIGESYKDKETDEWGCASVWIGDMGVEYNFCIDGGENYCAIYKMEFDHKTGYAETDYDVYEHYEIDFDDEHWMENLENAMCKALIEFFEL